MRPAAMAAEGIALLQDAVLTAARILGDPVSASDIVRLLGVRNDEGVGEGNVVRTVVAMLKAEHRLRADDTGAGSGFVSAKDAVGEHGAVAATLTGKGARGGSTGEKESSLKQGRVSALDARLALRESQLVAALERRLHEFEQKLVPGCDNIKAAALGAAAGEGSCSKTKERVMQDHMGTPLAAVDVDRLCAVRSRPLTTAAAHLGTRPPLDVWKEHIHMFLRHQTDSLSLKQIEAAVPRPKGVPKRHSVLELLREDPRFLIAWATGGSRVALVDESHDSPYESPAKEPAAKKAHTSPEDVSGWFPPAGLPPALDQPETAVAHVPLDCPPGLDPKIHAERKARKRLRASAHAGGVGSAEGMEYTCELRKPQIKVET